jgi:Holliday junction resolvase RusA-like endonuclease
MSYTVFIPGNPTHDKLAAAIVAGAYAGPRFEGNVSVRIDFWRETFRPCRLVNLVQTVLDALNGRAWSSPAQVWEISAGLDHEPSNPGVNVTIREV